VQNYVKANGTNFEVAGQKHVFKGISFGSWMNIESFMIGLPGCDMQIYSAIKEVYGAEQTKQFYDKFLNEFITESDIKYLAGLGVDLVRLPFSYRYFWNDNDINEVVEDGFVYLDRVIALCKKYGIYTILDMHTAPGGVGKDPHSDCMTGYNFFWDFENLQEVIIKIWGRIATHYKDETAVLGYDILNEPTKIDDFAVFNRFNNNTIREIRKFDSNHIIFVEGLDWGKDFSMITFEDTHQLAFSFHEYPSQVKDLIYGDKEWNRSHLSEHIEMILETMSKYQIPRWCGETGIALLNNGESAWPKSTSAEMKEMLRDVLAEFRSRDISWTTWTYKDNICMGLVRPKDDSDWARFTAEFGVKWDRDGQDSDTLGVFEKVKHENNGFDPLLENEVWYIMQNLTRHIGVKKHLIPELRNIPFETLLKWTESFRFENCVIAEIIEGAIKEEIKCFH